MTTSWQEALVLESSSLTTVLENLNQTGFKITLVVDESRALKGVVTDWDIRSALLKGLSLDTLVGEVMNASPMFASQSMSREAICEQMVACAREAMPVVNADGKLCDLVLLRDFVKPGSVIQDNPMVIMAGGKGKRLWPMTEDTPKPLLPVGDKPILEHILGHVQAQGLSEVHVVTHYKADKIQGFLDEKTPEGLDVSVIREENPLGTAGSLKQLESHGLDKPLFVMNGDILTRIDFDEMRQWHEAHQNVLTLASRHYQYQVPFGVLQTEGQTLVDIQEKPLQCFNINAGIYLIDPRALSYIPHDRYFDMTDLIDALIRAGEKVGAFPITESWLDVGTPQDYAHANENSESFVPV